MTEEVKMAAQQMFEDEVEDYCAYPSIPYFLFEDEMSSGAREAYNVELHQIRKYYSIYKKGNCFMTEGSNQDYIPSTLRYKKAAMIVNKEARFLFSNPPTFNVNPENVDNENTDENAIIQEFLEKVLEKNNFNGNILKALKDCFIGKRIAIVLNFNDNGITISFLNSLEFVFETSRERPDELTKFVNFYRINDTNSLSEQQWFKKKYTKKDGVVYLEEYIYSGTGELLETVTKKTPIKLDFIPATIVLNDGLIGDSKGESELEPLIDYEKYYSKLANADMDAERKSMNPIRWTIDASESSTRSLSTSPGSYWDLQTDQDKPNENTSARVGTLEAQMNYSSPLKVTLDRIENEMYNELDVPNITSEQLAGVITSGKTIQALYWGLTVRCDEKMLAWASSLKFMAYTIIKGATLYPNSISNYTDEKSIPDIPINIKVENNYPLPEDIKDEKELDISEVESKLMSRKAYLKKWRGLSDEKANEELQQIKLEQELLENAIISYNLNDGNDEQQTGKTDEFMNDDSKTNEFTEKEDSEINGN